VGRHSLCIPNPNKSRKYSKKLKEEKNAFLETIQTLESKILETKQLHKAEIAVLEFKIHELT
jgi:hypothetical protein